MTIPNRTLIVLSCAAFSLITTSRPLSRHIPSMKLNKSIQLQTLLVLVAIALVTLLPQSTNAIAIPEVVHGFPYTPQKLNDRGDGRLGRRTGALASPDCTDPAATEAAIPTGTLAGYSGIEPVTVTVTLGLPNSSSTHAPYATTTPGHASGSVTLNGTLAYASSSPPISTSTSSAPVGIVGPILASALEARRLNLAFQSLKTSDPCTPGQRACISNQIAQCRVPSSASDTPQWVTQPCVIGSDPNQTPVCAAVPDFTANSTTGAITNTTSSSSPVVLGCFNPADINQAFDTAGLQGGFLPPGTQASAAGRLPIVGKEVTGIGLITLLALIVTVML